MYDLGALLAEVQQKLKRDVPLSPHHVLCGSAADVREDSYHMSWCRGHLHNLELCERTCIHPQRLLNSSEQQRLRDYIAGWQRSEEVSCPFRDLICHLGDSPGTGWWTWSAHSSRIPTIRRSCGIFWTCATGRQVFLKELYSAMGFPAFPHLAAAAQVPTFQVWRPGLTHKHMLQALGNAQHVANIGVFATCAMACAAPSPPVECKKMSTRASFTFAWLCAQDDFWQQLCTATDRQWRLDSVSCDCGSYSAGSFGLLVIASVRAVH